jgi:hypothetical protein
MIIIVVLWLRPLYLSCIPKMATRQFESCVCFQGIITISTSKPQHIWHQSDDPESVDPCFGDILYCYSSPVTLQVESNVFINNLLHKPSTYEIYSGYYEVTTSNGIVVCKIYIDWSHPWYCLLARHGFKLGAWGRRMLICPLDGFVLLLQWHHYRFCKPDLTK